MKIKKERSIYGCWCASPSQPGSGANMSNPAILVQPSIIPSRNTRPFLWRALRVQRPAPSHLSIFLSSSSGALTVKVCFLLQLLWFLPLLSAPTCRLSISPKHGGWHKLVSALRWFQWLELTVLGQVLIASVTVGEVWQTWQCEIISHMSFDPS